MLIRHWRRTKEAFLQSRSSHPHNRHSPRGHVQHQGKESLLRTQEGLNSNYSLKFFALHFVSLNLSHGKKAYWPIPCMDHLLSPRTALVRPTQADKGWVQDVPLQFIVSLLLLRFFDALGSTWPHDVAQARERGDGGNSWDAQVRSCSLLHKPRHFPLKYRLHTSVSPSILLNWYSSLKPLNTSIGQKQTAWQKVNASNFDLQIHDFFF